MGVRAAPSRGAWVGLALLGTAVAVEVAVVWSAWRVWPGPRAAVLGLVGYALLPPLLWLAYWVWGYFSLRYELSRDGLVIRWAANRQIVPMTDITHVLNGRPYAAPLAGLRWPGYEIGQTSIAIDEDEPPRQALVYATVPPDGQLLIVTSDVAYAVSPADRNAFVEDFKVRRRLGTVQRLDQQTAQAFWARIGIWRDSLALPLVALGVALNALAFAWLTWRYPALPEQVAMGFRYDAAAGEAVAGPMGALASMWLFPATGLAALVGNTVAAALVHPRARLGARLLLLGAALLQVAILIALAKLA